MLEDLTMFRRAVGSRTRRARLGLERLEGRETPATLVVLDFNGISTADFSRVQAAMPASGQVTTPPAQNSFVDQLQTLNTQFGGFSRYSFLDLDGNGTIDA